MAVSTWQGNGTRSSFGATVNSVTPAITTTSINAGDIIFIEVGTKNNETHVCNQPDDWKQIGPQINSGTSWTSSLWVGKVPTTGSLAAPTFSWTSLASGFAQSWSVERADVAVGESVTDAVRLVASRASTGSPHTLTGGFTTGPNSLLMYVGSAGGNTAYGAVTSYTERVDGGSATGATRNVVGTRAITTSGSTTGNISSSGTTAAWVMRLVEILEPFAGIKLKTITDGDAGYEDQGVGWTTSGIRQGSQSGNLMWSAFRFQNVIIPPGSSVTSATLRLRGGYVTISGSTWGNLFGDLTGTGGWSISPSVPRFVTDRTTASTPFTSGSADALVSLNVTSVIQEIINHASWTNGRVLRLFGDPTGNNGVISYLSRWQNADMAPELWIEFTEADTTVPTITSTATASVAENATLSKALTANETVTWSIRSTAQDAASTDASSFELSGSTLRWTSNGTKDYESPNDSNTNNTYVVVVRATDTSNNTTDQTITVTVTDVANPTITSGTSTSVAEGAALAFGLTADVSVTWTIRTSGQNANSTDHTRFKITGSTLSWADGFVPDYENPLDSNGNNTYVVVVRATAASGEFSELSITTTVTNVTTPVITSSATISKNEGEELSHTLTADKAVTWSIRTVGQNAASLDHTRFLLTGSQITWADGFTTDFSSPSDSNADNVYAVVVRATEAVAGEYAEQTITVTITDTVDLTEVVLTSGTSWTLPNDVDVTQPLNVTVIGAGGGGGRGIESGAAVPITLVVGDSGQGFLGYIRSGGRVNSAYGLAPIGSLSGEPYTDQVVDCIIDSSGQIALYLTGDTSTLPITSISFNGTSYALTSDGYNPDLDVTTYLTDYISLGFTNGASFNMGSGTGGVGYSGGAGGGGAWVNGDLDISSLTAGSSTLYTSFGTPGTGAATFEGGGTAGGDVWINKSNNTAPGSLTTGMLAKGGGGGEGTGVAYSPFPISKKTSPGEDLSYRTTTPGGAAGTIDPPASTIYVGDDGEYVYAGYRFTDLAIPTGTSIISATFSFISPGSVENIPFFTVKANKVANAPAWDSSSRPDLITSTTSTVLVSSIIGGLQRNNVDVTAMIAEIYALPGWASGNAISIILDPMSGSAGVSVPIYTSSLTDSYAPMLIVAYGVPGDGPGGGGIGGIIATSIGTTKITGSTGSSGNTSNTNTKGGAAGRFGIDPKAGDGGLLASGSNNGYNYGGGGGNGTTSINGGNGAPGVIVIRYTPVTSSSTAITTFVAGDFTDYSGYFPFFGMGSANPTTAFGYNIGNIITSLSEPDLLFVVIEEADVRASFAGKSLKVNGVVYPLNEGAYPLSFDGNTHATYDAPGFWFANGQTYTVELVDGGAVTPPPVYVFKGQKSWSAFYKGVKTTAQIYKGPRTLIA